MTLVRSQRLTAPINAGVPGRAPASCPGFWRLPISGSWCSAPRSFPKLTRTSAKYGSDFWVEAPHGKPTGTEQQSAPQLDQVGAVHLHAASSSDKTAVNGSWVQERGQPVDAEQSHTLVQDTAEASSSSSTSTGPNLEPGRLSSNGFSTEQAIDTEDGSRSRSYGLNLEEAPSSVPAPQPVEAVPQHGNGGLFGLGDFVGSLFGGKQAAPELVEIKGTIMLAKKNILDFVNPSAFADNLLDILGRRVELRLVSCDLHPETKDARLSAPSSIDDWAFSDEVLITGEDDPYPITFKVPPDFGEPGAILVKNNHMDDFHLSSITLTLPDSTTIEFPCNSWVYPSSYYPDDRIFFSNKHYLPSNTPASLEALRKRELAEKRGDGTGDRKPWERIYDYDVYNDLANPDAHPPICRPVLGGSKAFPYPRRLRTGRSRCRKDPNSEVPVFMLDLEATYKPRDEVMSRKNYSSFLAAGLKGAVHALLPAISFHFDQTPNEFDAFSEITDLYDKGLDLEESLEKTVDADTLGSGKQEDPLVLMHQLSTSSGGGNVIKFPKPQVVATDEKAWTTDEEFGRQFLAGMHPCTIELLKEFPPTSNFDPDVYGPASALTREHIEPYLDGLTVEQAMASKKLFIVDYDVVKPYINKIIALGEAKIYSSHTILLLKEGKMKPIAIELSLPPCPENGTEGSIRVFTAPPESATETDYLWLLAKIHVGSADLGFHELFSHWMSTHAVLEPFIISLHRNLSALHPIFTLLLPHTKNTILMNGIGRQSLINADGIIERSTAPGKYGMEMSAKLYGGLWHFDNGNLPKELISRGMAEKTDDPSYPGGVKLVLEDYPYAKDGLEIWDAISKWVKTYVQITYNGSDEAVQSDAELQAFWNEAITVGHADLADRPWWPKLDSVSSLESALTTLIWTAGPMHAAVNFGQYAYAGYMPNRCPTVRRLVPEEGSPEHLELLADPDMFVLSTLATQSVTAIALLTTEVLSNHSVDEEYLGQRITSNWTSDPAIQAAFAAFGEEITAIGRRIKERNQDPALFNRRGPANVPYTLLYPTSPPGVTGRGVPNSPCV